MDKTLVLLQSELAQRIRDCENAAEEYAQELSDDTGCREKLAEAKAYREILELIQEKEGVVTAPKATKKIFRQICVGILFEEGLSAEKAAKKGAEIIDAAEELLVFHPALKDY